MQPMRMPIRVVFYRDEGIWVAHCLEFDLLGHGPAQEEALRKLAEAIRLQVEATLEYDNPANLFSPAEGRYFRMFAAGEDVTGGELTLDVEPTEQMHIEDVELREFVELQAAAL
jgi:predicted RNase H-like HicB family nuclease